MDEKSAIIFDMDGTLLDSSKSMTKSINYVRSKLSLPPFSVEKVVKLINEPDNDLPKLFYEDKMPYSECRKLFEEHYHDNCIVNMELYDGVKDALNSLYDKKYKMAILSNAYGNFVRKMTKHKNVSHFFELSLGSDDIGSRKPSPDGIFYILSKLSVKKEKSVYVGDSLKDEMAARNAGIRYIFVDWGFGESKNPDAIISKDSINEIDKVIKKLIL